jgi:hypothetical protein
MSKKVMPYVYDGRSVPVERCNRPATFRRTHLLGEPRVDTELAFDEFYVRHDILLRCYCYELL